MKQGIGKKVLLLSLISLFTDMASEMLYPVMPSYLKSIGFSVLLIGILEGIAEAISGLSKGFFGQWSDQVNRRMPFVRAGYSLSAISKPLLALSALPLWVFLSRTIDRLGKGIRSAPRDAVLTEESQSGNRGAVFGLHRAMDTIGAMLGPVLAMGLLAMFPGNYKLLFLVAFIPGMLAVLITFIIKEASRQAAKQNRPGFIDFIHYIKRANTDYKKLITVLLLFALFNSSDVFILLRLKETGLSDISVLAMYLFYNLIFALAAFPIGIKGDTLGMKRPLLIGLLFFSVTYVLLSSFSTLWVVLVALFFYGLFSASTDGISKAWISLVCEDKDKGTAIGTFLAFQSIAALFASIIAGGLWSALGSHVALLFAAAGSLICWLLIRFMKIANNSQ